MRRSAPEGFFERRARVNSVQLIEVDALKLEAAQAHFDTLDQIAGAAHVLGFSGALARDAALGCNDEAGRVGRERFANEAFGDLGAVGVGSVDEGDAKLDGEAQHASCFGCSAGSPQAPSPTRRMVP